jgi:hypothetical protein
MAITYDDTTGLYYDDATGQYSTSNDFGSSSGSSSESSSGLTSSDKTSIDQIQNSDGSVTTYYSDGTSSTSNPSQATKQTAVDQVQNADGTVTTTYSDGSQSTTTPQQGIASSTGTPNTLSGIISKIATGTLSSKDIANFAASNAGNIAALTGLAALTGGNTPTTGAYTGKIPTLQAIRNQVNAAVPPGQSQQYFTDTRYVNPNDATAVANAQAASTSQAQAIIDAAQKQAAARAAAQPVVPSFAMPWVNQTAAGNTPVTAANNAGLPAVIDRSSPGYNYGSNIGASIIPGQNTSTTGNTAADAAALKAQQNAAAKAAADAAALNAQQDAAAKAAAATAAAAAKVQQQQTDIGNIVKMYTDPTGKITDPVKANQAQVAIAQYMDKNGISPSQLPNIAKNASYATGWTPDLINSIYKTVDPLAQVATAYQSGQSPSAVAALANKNNVDLTQLQNYGLSTQQINDLALKGYLGNGSSANPLLTSLLTKDYASATPADIANINAIAKAQNLTPAQVQQMFPGVDLYQVSQAGVNLSGYTAPTQTLQDMYNKGDIAGINNLLKTQNINAKDVTSMFNGIDLGAISNQGINIPGYTYTQSATPVNVDTSTASAPSYTSYSNQNIADYIAQNGIDVSNAGQVAAAVQATNADPGAVNSYIASNYPTSSSDNSGAKAGGLMGYAHGGISGIPRYLKGDTDGMADDVPSSIDGVQPAKLSHGEFVIPADVVSHLGNGNSDAGAKKLYQMMDKVRMARTGTKKQGKEINPDKFMIGGHAYSSGGEIAFSKGGIPGFSGTTTSQVGTSSGVSTPSLGYSTVNALSPWAGDYVTNMLGSAQALANSPMPVYQGELTAGPSNLQNQQFAGLSALAQTGAPPVQFQTGTWSNQGAGAMPDVTRPSDTSLVSQAANNGTAGFGQPMQLNTGDTGVAGQYMNPYLQQSLQPQLDLLSRNAQINTLGDLGKMTGQGAFGGSRQAVLQGINEGNLLGQQANLIGQGYNTAYNNAMQQFNNEQNLGLQAQQNQQQANQASANFGLQSLNALGTAGGVQQGLTQAADTAAQNQFNQQALYPYQQLQFQQSMLSNLPISTQAVIPNTSPISNAAGALNTSISLTDALKQLGQG